MAAAGQEENLVPVAVAEIAQIYRAQVVLAVMAALVAPVVLAAAALEVSLIASIKPAVQIRC